MCSFLCYSAQQWSSKRRLLDQQEAEMLARVRELREKVASQMSTTASYDSASDGNQLLQIH